MCCRCSENREFWLSRILKFLKLISGFNLRKKRRIKIFGEWCISKVRACVAHPTRTTTIKLVCSIGMQVPIEIRGLAFRYCIEGMLVVSEGDFLFKKVELKIFGRDITNVVLLMYGRQLRIAAFTAEPLN